MTTRDILRKEMNKFNEHFGIKNNPTRNLNSIQECRDNLYHQVDKLIKTRGTTANKQMYDENKNLKSKIEGLMSEVDKEKEEQDKILVEKIHYKSLYDAYCKKYSNELGKNIILNKELIKSKSDTVKIKKKLITSNFLLVTTTVFTVLETIIIFILLSMVI